MPPFGPLKNSERTILNIQSFVTGLALLLVSLGNAMFSKKAVVLFFVLNLFLMIWYANYTIFTRFFNWVSIFALLAWCGLSYTWSQFPQDTLDGFYWQCVFVFTVLLFGILSGRLNVELVVKNAFIAALVLNVAYILLFPGASLSENGLRSMYYTKNSLGFVCAYAFLMLVFLNQPRRIDYIFAAIAVFLLLLSLSKTSMALVVVVSILLLAKNYCFGRGRIFFPQDSYLLIVLATLLVTALLIAGISFFYKEILNYVFLNLDSHALTGRGQIWIELLRNAESKIVYGLGFNAVWGMDHLNEIYLTELGRNNPLWATKLAAADGGYVDVVVAIGLVGLVVLGLVVVQLFLNILRSQYVNIGLVVLAVVLIHNLTETTFLMGFNLNWFLLMFVAGLALSRSSSAEAAYE